MTTDRSTQSNCGVGWDVAPAVANWPGLPPLDGDRTVDACVVGLGASGLEAVQQLSAQGLSVIGVDEGRVAAGASGRNGGFLLAGPAPFLHSAIAEWGPCAVDLYNATLAELKRTTDRIDPRAVRPTGSIRLAGLPGPAASESEQADRERDVMDCQQHAAALRQHGIAVKEYEGPLGTGLFLPDDAAMNPPWRALEMAKTAVVRADLFEQTPVTEVRSTRVRTTRGTIHASVVIVAVDGRLEQLLPQLRGSVRTARLQMLATDPVDRLLESPVYGRWGYDFAHQTPDGRLFVGGGRDRFESDEWTTDVRTTPNVQSYIERVAWRVVDGPIRVTHRWAASVGFTPDAKPLCSRVDDGVVAIGGYSGTGNLVGVIAARAGVQLALSNIEPPPYFTSI